VQERPFRTTALDEMSRDVREARAAVAARAHATERLAQARQAREALDERIAELEVAAADERKDVERLEGRSAAKVLHTLLGSLAERREKERQELAAATLKVEQARAERVALDEEIRALTARIDALADAGVWLERARAAKIAWMEVHDQPSAQLLAEIARRDTEVAAEEHRAREAFWSANEAHDTFGQLSRDLLRAEKERWPGSRPSEGLLRLLDHARERLPRLHTVLTRLHNQCHELGIESGNPATPSIEGGRHAANLLDIRVKDPTTGQRMSELRRDTLDSGRMVEMVANQLRSRLTALAEHRSQLGARREAIIDG
jgi:hypothetical protein